MNKLYVFLVDDHAAMLKPLFQDLLAKQQAHIRTLDGLMSKG